MNRRIGRQRGFLGLIVILIALLIVAWLSMDALKAYGVMSGVGPAPKSVPAVEPARGPDPQERRTQRQGADDEPDEEAEAAGQDGERRPGVGEPGQERQDEDAAGEQRPRDVGVTVGDGAATPAARPGHGVRQAERGAGHRGDQRQRLPPGGQQRHPERAGGPGDDFQASARAPQGETSDDSGAQGAGCRPGSALAHADGWHIRPTGYRDPPATARAGP